MCSISIAYISSISKPIHFWFQPKIICCSRATKSAIIGSVPHFTSLNSQPQPLKLGMGSAPFLGRVLDPHLTQSRLGRGLPSYQVASWCIQPFGHNRNGPKIGEGAPLHFWEGELGLHLAQCGLNQGPPLCQVPSWSIQRFGHNGRGPKIGEGVPPPFCEGGAGWLSNTKSPGPRPTSTPSGILIHPDIWPQQIWAENWGLCPFGGGELGPI